MSAPIKPNSNGRVLEEVMAMVKRFVVLSDEQLIVIGLWVVHTHALDAALQTPYMLVMPDELLAIANHGEFDEFDLNAFFAATGAGASAEFKHKDDVQKWLDIIRGSYAPTQVDNLKLGSQRPPFPYSDVRLLEYLRHSFWFLPNVAACDAMANLLAESHNTFWHDYSVLIVAGKSAGVGLDALPPVRHAIGSGDDTKTITLSCGKARHWGHGASMDVDLYVTQPEIAGDLFPSRVSGSVAVVDQEPRRRRPGRGGHQEAGLLRI